MLVLILIAVTVCLFLLLILRRDSFRDLFSPQVILTLFFLLFYIFPGFWFIRGKDIFSKAVEPFFIGGEITQPIKIYALILSFLAFLFLIGGIYFVYWLHNKFGHKKIFTCYKIHFYGFKFTTILLLYLSFGILLTGLLLKNSGGILAVFYNLGSKFELMTGKYFLTFGPVFFGVASILLLFRNKKIKFSFLLVLILAVFSAFIQVNRGMIFILLLTIFLSYNYYVKPIGTRKIIIYSALLFLGGIAYKVLQVFLVSSFSIMTFFKLRFWAYYWNSIWRDISGDTLIGPQQLSLILKGVPSILGYQNGKTLFGFPLVLIPRALFPDKPLVSGVGIFTQNLFSNIGGTTIPPGFVGELYMNFSIIGVIFGMFASGLFLGETYWRMKHRKSAFMIFLYSYSLFFYLYLLRGEFMLINRYIVFVLLFWFALRFSSKEKWLLEK